VGSDKIYVGYKHHRICLVSTHPCQSQQFDVLEVDRPKDVVDLRTITEDYKIWRGQLVHKTTPIPIQELRIALVGVYKIPCGISTYAEALWAEQTKLVKDFRIFSEFADLPTEPNVTRCWKRGESLEQLTAEIDAFDPDLVLIQHEFGIFPNARYWLSFIGAMQKYRTVATLHSVFRHADKTICEAVLPEVVVHTNLARNVLVKEKKIFGKVHVFSHGCFLPKTNQERLWNRYCSEHTLMQFGFGFRYKGWERSLEVVARLKSKYPDIFFTGLFSESVAGPKAHDEYFHELTSLIDRLGIRENVSLIRGYQSQETLESFFKTNRVALFPYVNHPDHVVFGSTGAARVAMVEGIPVVVSDVPLFHDLEGICPRAGTTEALCQAVEAFFDPAKAKAQVELQNAFLKDNSWAQVARKQLELFSKYSP
jgi:glycosyltransferase involved in cell wall biosynthesis